MKIYRRQDNTFQISADFFLRKKSVGIVIAMRTELRSTDVNSRRHYHPNQCGSVGWVLSLKAKGHQFDSRPGHVPALQVLSQWEHM